ncbi:alpha-maltose-1-phosphate synthase [Methylomarinovum caldicuralii]|uniref:Alpha-maltose-1-phosphate synthase n=1 Tax=Methylomarinovum caldicuralii TaxID=438856 RepID=A0AAU9BPQ0_9GAMM|nr:glycosyltransferase family 4 protein [Methylomarinovum caldicuralii]BCX80688.1 alpha-maltose-1-phosphate synthase [Methylomarinovum caldicuralii]
MDAPAVWFPAVRAGSGADVFTERLCAGLNARGLRAAITWLPHRAEYAPWSVPVPKPPAWANIVHVNSWLHPRFLPQGLPIVSTLHACVHDDALNRYKSRLQSLYHRYWIRPIEAATLRRATRVVAVSRYTAGMAEKAFDVSGIRVIYNGIDCSRFTPIERDHPQHPFRLLYVGNWSRRKGVDLLAPIMEALGDGFELAYTADREGAHERYALPPNCRNLGRLSGESLVTAYQQADALLFPSRLEGFGLVAAEAMACGLPVIAANTSSLPEVVEHEQTGLLCPADAIDAFVQAARTLATDIARWRMMRQAARQRVINLFDASQQVDKYIELYSGTRNITST